MLFGNLHGGWNRRTIGEPHYIGGSLTAEEFVGGCSGPSYGEAYQFYMDEFHEHTPQCGFYLMCIVTAIATVVWVIATLKAQRGFFHSAGSTGITITLAIMCLLCGYGWSLPRREARRFARYACRQTANVRTAYIQAIRHGVCSGI